MKDQMKEPKKFTFKHGDNPIKAEKKDTRLHIIVETKGALGPKLEEPKKTLKEAYKMMKDTKIIKQFRLSHNVSDKIEKEIK
jgi:hypothetical protein